MSISMRELPIIKSVFQGYIGLGDNNPPEDIQEKIKLISQAAARNHHYLITTPYSECNRLFIEGASQIDNNRILGLINEFAHPNKKISFSTFKSRPYVTLRLAIFDFNEKENPLPSAIKTAIYFIHKYHPNYKALDDFALSFHILNYLMFTSCFVPLSCIIYWSSPFSIIDRYKLVLKQAELSNIPVFNLNEVTL